MQRLQRWVLLGLLAFGTAGKLDRLEDAERTHFLALRVFMTEKDQKAFLKLKTTALRDQWLKDHGLWARFYQYDARRREDIADGHVATGWTQDQVFMAWGPPTNARRASTPPCLAASRCSRTGSRSPRTARSSCGPKAPRRPTTPRTATVSG